MTNGFHSANMPPQTSPAVLALRRINEALSKTVTPPSGLLPSPSANVNGTPPTPLSQQPSPSAEANVASVQRAEQLKNRLLDALKQEDNAEITKTIDEIEATALTREALEISRIGAVVNGLRRTVAETNPNLARKCRSLIKSWRSNVVESSRPASSCGSSNSGTPALISPAIRKGLTPRGSTVTPNGNLAVSIDVSTTNGSYAPVNNKILQPNGQKRKAEISPQLLGAKKPKKSPAISPNLQDNNSVMAARRNVQSTDQLIAALGMESLLEKKFQEIEKVVDARMGAPKFDNRSSARIVVPPIVEKKPAQRKRATKTKKETITPTATGSTTVPRLKIRFGGRPSSPKIENGSGVKMNGINLAPVPQPPPAPHRPKFSWYDTLPSVQDLEKRAEQQKKQPIDFGPSEDPTDSAIWKYRDRRIVLMPYIDTDEPDFLLFDYPDKERFVQ